MGNSAEKPEHIRALADPYFSALKTALEHSNEDQETRINPRRITAVGKKSLQDLANVLQSIGPQLRVDDWIEISNSIQDCTTFLEVQAVGSYLVSQPNKDSPDLCLLVRLDSGVEQFQITYSSTDKYVLAIDNSRSFRTLNELLDHYKMSHPNIPFVLSPKSPKLDLAQIDEDLFSMGEETLPASNSSALPDQSSPITVTETKLEAPSTIDVVAPKIVVAAAMPNYEEWDPATSAAFYGLGAAVKLETPAPASEEAFGFDPADDDSSYGTVSTAKVSVTRASSTKSMSSMQLEPLKPSSFITANDDNMYGSASVPTSRVASLKIRDSDRPSSKSPSENPISEDTDAPPIPTVGFSQENLSVESSQADSSGNMAPTIGPAEIPPPEALDHSVAVENVPSFKGAKLAAENILARLRDSREGISSGEQSPDTAIKNNELASSASSPTLPMLPPNPSTTSPVTVNASTLSDESAKERLEQLPVPPPRTSKDLGSVPNSLENSQATNNGGPIYEIPVQIGRRINTNPADVFEWFRGVDARCRGAVRSPLWIHSSQLSRKETERIFARYAMQTGLFLVRQRTTKDSELPSFALSIVIDKKSEHHIIDVSIHGYSIEGTHNLQTVTNANTLEDLINQLAISGKSARPILSICVPVIDEDKYDRPDWLHGSISREEANARLFEDGQFVDGRFLVRLSGNQHQRLAYVVSMIFDQKVFHHLVTPEKEGWYLNGQVCPGCASLTDVVNFLREPNPSLPCPLRTYVPTRPPYELVRRDPIFQAPPPILRADPTIEMRPRMMSTSNSRPMSKQSSSGSMTAPEPPPLSALPRQSSRDSGLVPFSNSLLSVPRRSLDVTPMPVDPSGSPVVPQRSFPRAPDHSPVPPGARRSTISTGGGLSPPPRRESLEPPPSPGAPQAMRQAFSNTSTSSSPPPSPRMGPRTFENVYVDANTIFYELDQLVRPDEEFQLVREADNLPPTFIRLSTLDTTKFDSVPKDAKPLIADIASN